jgi:hypothetical protein
MTRIGVGIPCSRDAHRQSGLGIACDITHLRDAGGCQGVGGVEEGAGRGEMRRAADVSAAEPLPQFPQCLQKYYRARPGSRHCAETASDGSAVAGGRVKRMDKVVAAVLEAVPDVPEGASLAVGGVGLSGEC